VIWDDTQGMPLLYDDYEEFGDNCLIFEAEEVNAFPPPDMSVVVAKAKQYALKACDALNAGDLDGARKWAENVALARQEFRGTSGQQQPGPTGTLAVQDIDAVATVHEGDTASHDANAPRRFDVHLYPVMRLKMDMIEARSPTDAVQQAIGKLGYFNGIWPYNMEFAEDFDGFVVDEKGKPDANGCVPLKTYSFDKDGVTPTGANIKDDKTRPARLVVSMVGGLVQAVFADTAQPLQCAVFDLDTEGADIDELAVLANGTEFIGHIEPVSHKEGFVDEVFNSFRR
jgi:hypothetical protein